MNSQIRCPSPLLSYHDDDHNDRDDEDDDDSNDDEDDDYDAHCGTFFRHTY